MSISNDLRQAVLQAAIQGKLTKQLPEDGNAKDLLEQIKAEKAKFVKEGKLKKEKTLPVITEDEKPFDIPENWEWVRLGEVSTYGCTKKKINAQEASSDTWLLDLEDIEKGGALLQKKTVVESKARGEKTVFEKGNILYSKLRPYLLKILEADDAGICTPELVPFGMYGDIDNRYVICFLKSPYVDVEINKLTYGVKMPRVGTETMLNFLFPLPPLSEQKRIVTKIEELLAKINYLEKTEKELEALKKAFPADMKAALLQAAMQGKLTEQLPEDGNAKDLLEQIKAEKAKLVKDGKLKKEKPLPEITEDEKPFDIPENWKWCRLGEFIRIESGVGLTSSQMCGGEYPVYGGNGITGYHNEYILDKKTVVIGRVGFYCGSVHVTESKAWVTDNAFITTYPEKHIDRGYLVYVLRHMDLGKNKNATAQPVVSGKKIYPLLFPLPPLSEQKRIVEKLEKLLPLCDGLK